MFCPDFCGARFANLCTSCNRVLPRITLLPQAGARHGTGEQPPAGRVRAGACAGESCHATSLPRHATSLTIEFEREHAQRRKLLNQVETLKGAIRVLCRVRPPGAAQTTAVTFPPAPSGAAAGGGTGRASLVISGAGPRGDQRRLYEYDTIFPPDASQEQVAAQASGWLLRVRCVMMRLS